MNEHEAQRIAAAAHELRPDWPATSILTIIRKHLIDKPRRDVSVALAWVACESGTASPARVLEAGPWWRAAGIDGANTREPFDQAAFCATCGKPESRCQRTRIADDDHPFESVLSVRQRREAGEFDTARTVDHLRDLVVDAKAAPEPAPEKPAPPQNPHAERARDFLASLPETTESIDECIDIANREAYEEVMNPAKEETA